MKVAVSVEPRVVTARVELAVKAWVTVRAPAFVVVSPLLPRVNADALAEPKDIVPSLPVPLPASMLILPEAVVPLPVLIVILPELLVTPSALPEVMVIPSELVEAELVLELATLAARKAYGTAVSLNLGVISASAGEQEPQAQLVVPRIVIPRYRSLLQSSAGIVSYSPKYTEK